MDSPSPLLRLFFKGRECRLTYRLLSKDDYFLFLGRINRGKGTHIAMQIVEAVGGRLIIAGPGDLGGKETRTDRPVSEYVKLVGVVGSEERKSLMSRAKAT